MGAWAAGGPAGWELRDASRCVLAMGASQWMVGLLSGGLQRAAGGALPRGFWALGARSRRGGVFVRAVRMAMPYTGRKLRGMLVDGRLTPSDVVWPLSARAALSMTVGLAWRALVPMEW